MIWYRFKIRESKSLWFNSEAYDPKYYLLTELIKGDYLPFYRNFIFEISEIEKGKKDVFEDSYDVGGGLSFELKITKETTYCETWTDVRKCLELPTAEFKELIENWIKFVEVNTAAFKSKA
jgi:hypothetical protein